MTSEISIIGGNVAGVSAAVYLKEKQPSLGITIYEPQVWNKPCGGAVSVEWYTYLKEKFDLTLAEAHQTAELRTGLWSGRFVSTDSPFVLTHRNELQEKLLEVARKQGVEVIERRVKQADLNLFTPQTIVAAGHSGITRTLMDQRWHKRDLAQIIRFDGVVPEVQPPDASFIILDNKQVGYGWVFVGSKGHINVGLGGLGSPKVIKERYQLFIELMRDKYGLTIPPDKVKPEGWGLPLPINKWKYKVANTLKSVPGVEFVGVGDALGLAHPILGAGIEPGWQSGWLLAECFDPQTERVDTKRYARLLRRNHKLASGRTLDLMLARGMRSRFLLAKDRFGYVALKLFMDRMIDKMRQYPWYAYVADESGPFNKTGKHWDPVVTRPPSVASD